MDLRDPTKSGFDSNSFLIFSKSSVAPIYVSFEMVGRQNGSKVKTFQNWPKNGIFGLFFFSSKLACSIEHFGEIERHLA